MQASGSQAGHFCVSWTTRQHLELHLMSAFIMDNTLSLIESLSVAWMLCCHLLTSVPCERVYYSSSRRSSRNLRPPLDFADSLPSTESIRHGISTPPTSGYCSRSVNSFVKPVVNRDFPQAFQLAKLESHGPNLGYFNAL